MILFHNDKINFHIFRVEVRMTDPIKSIGGAPSTAAGGSYSGGSPSEEHRKKSPAAPQGDLVEISQDARDRSSGKKRKNILEYLKEIFG